MTGQYGFGRNNLKLGLAGNQGPNQLNQYWTMEEEVYGDSHFIHNKKDTKPSFTENIKVVTFNDRKAPSTLSFISGYGYVCQRCVCVCVGGYVCECCVCACVCV